jgi:hypothetical protein
VLRDDVASEPPGSSPPFNLYILKLILLPVLTEPSEVEEGQNERQAIIA